MGQNTGLPSGAGQWARDVNEGLAKLKEIEAIARRICNDFGLDFSNPSRGLYTGATPSVDNPVQLKLPSLQDLEIRDAQDGDLLTFDGATGTWTARRHNAVQLPKEFPVGDPDSYYVPEPEEPVGGISWSPLFTSKNFITDPSFELAFGNDWSWVTPANGYSSDSVLDVEFVISASQPHAGSSSLHVSVTWLDPDNLGSGFAGTLRALTPPLPLNTKYFGAFFRALAPQSSISALTAGLLVFDAADQVVASVPSEGVTDSNPYIYANATVDNWTYRGTNPAWATGITVPEGGSIRGYVYLDNLPPHTERQFHIDSIIASDAQPPTRHLPFNGDTPDGNSVEYGWDGAQNASTSTATQLRRVGAPTVITLGEEFTIQGEGFNPGEAVTLYINSWTWQSAPATADAEGNFAVPVTIAVIDDPEYDPTEPPDVNIYAWSAATTHPPSLDVTFEQ